MTTSPSRVQKGVPSGGQFAASSRDEADVALTSEPLSAAEFGIAADKSVEMRMMGVDDVVGLPDGSDIEIVPGPGDDSVVGDIVERGTYVRTYPNGYKVGSEFGDLYERSEVTDQIAFDAVREARTVTEDPLTEARAEQAAEARYAAEVAAGIEPGTSRSGVRTDDAGKRVVDDPDSFWHGTEIISTYTRDQALADGALKNNLADGTDLNQMAREAGIPVPVAFTAAAFEDSVAWKGTNAELQDESGRAWDVLWMANRPIRAHAAKTNGSLRVGDRIPFTFVRVPNTPRATQPRKQTLVAVFGTDDQGEPCFTIMKEDED